MMKVSEYYRALTAKVNKMPLGRGERIRGIATVSATLLQRKLENEDNFQAKICIHRLKGVLQRKLPI